MYEQTGKMPDDPFFPGSGQAHLAREAAKACSTCPVLKSHCEPYTKALNQKHGIWAGKLRQPANKMRHP